MSETVKRLSIALLLLCLVLGYIYQQQIFEQFGTFLAWVQVHPLEGALLYIILYSITAVFCIPAVILTLGSGYIFTSIYDGGKGYAMACIVDFAGATCGALLAFLVCRLLFFNWVNVWAKQYKQFEIAQVLMKKDGRKVMLLLRVLMPYNPLNYLLGITNVSVIDYVLCCAGMIPSTLGWCFVGSTLTALSEINKMQEKGISGLYRENPSVMIIGIAFISLFIFGMMWITNKAKTEFKAMMDKAESGKKSK